MAPDRKDSTRSVSSMGFDRKESVKNRPHSSNTFNRKEPLTSSSSSQGLSALAALGVDQGGLSRENSKKGRDKVGKERERKPKMDVARASGIMGFSSGRWLDKSTKDTDPKKELDKALFTRMQDLLKKKRAFQKEKLEQQDALERAQSLKGKSKDPNGNHKPKSATRKSSSSKPPSFAQDGLTGFQKRKAQAGEDKIQDDIMNLHEAYQFLMKKYKLGERQAMLRAAGTIVGLGAKTMSGSGNSGDFDDDNLFSDLRIGDERDDEKDVFA